MEIPGISAIWLAMADALPKFVRESHLIGQKPLILCDLVELPVGPKATASDNSENTSEGFSVKSELSFSVSGFDIPNRKHLAFVFLASDGRFFLIGSKLPPYPAVKIKNDRSTPDDGQAGYSVSVEWAGPLIECLTNLPSF